MESPSPGALHHWVVGCQARAGRAESSTRQQFLLLISCFLSDPSLRSFQNASCWAPTKNVYDPVVMASNRSCPPPHLLPCPLVAFSSVLDPLTASSLGPAGSVSHPSLSPGRYTRMRMAQMTSSLQRQEVRIPAILCLPFRPLLWLFSSPPVWLPATFPPASSRSTLVWQWSLLSSLQSSEWEGREICFLFDF